MSLSNWSIASYNVRLSRGRTKLVLGIVVNDVLGVHCVEQGAIVTHLRTGKMVLRPFVKLGQAVAFCNLAVTRYDWSEDNPLPSGNEMEVMADSADMVVTKHFEYVK